MSYGKSHYETVITYDNRSASVDSAYSASTRQYQSQSSYESSCPSSYSERKYRDPKAENHIVEVKDRKHRSGKVVSVTNYHQRNNETNEPNPGYQGGYYYPVEEKKHRHKSG